MLHDRFHFALALLIFASTHRRGGGGGTLPRGSRSDGALRIRPAPGPPVDHDRPPDLRHKRLAECMRSFRVNRSRVLPPPATDGTPGGATTVTTPCNKRSTVLLTDTKYARVN